MVKVLMARHKIPISNVVQHNRWSGKDCLHYLRNGKKGISWDDFIGIVKGGASASKPAEKTASRHWPVFANRKKLAAKHGITVNRTGPEYAVTKKMCGKILNKKGMLFVPSEDVILLFAGGLFVLVEKCSFSSDCLYNRFRQPPVYYNKSAGF